MTRWRRPAGARAESARASDGRAAGGRAGDGAADGGALGEAASGADGRAGDGRAGDGAADGGALGEAASGAAGGALGEAASGSTGRAAGDSPVEVYLDRLLAAAPGSPRDVRALLSEAESHLRDATAEGMASGLSQAEAEYDAVARFGTVRSVAAAEARRSSVPLAALVRQVGASGLLLGAIGGIAVGVSGILTAILGAFGGSAFIVDISPATHLAPSDCARWLANDPRAHSCYQAALSDWAGEIVGFRLVAGVAGLLALAAFLVVRRRWPRLPATVVDTIAVTLFGLAGAWMLGLGIDWVAQGHNGAGEWLGAAPVALALGAFYGYRLLRDLRHAPNVATT
ncbi:MAG: hypothetical protein QOF30_3172 [Acidimicrobiaceae bacterium]|nr:hypothetical protein [Acidimicrobiaceae bacterium]